MQKISVIGGGSWATAIVKILSEQIDVRINWWIRHESDVEHILKYQHNPNYLSGINIDLSKVLPSTDLRTQILDSEIVILAVPSAFIKGILDNLTKEDLKDKVIVSAIKGMIPGHNYLISEYVEKHFNISPDNVFAIAGPCHSEEIALEKQSYLTIAAKRPENGQVIADLFSCRYVKACVIEDLYGIEYCAIMKNIIALACGVARGLNYGDNFQAVLVSNAMSEIKGFLDVIAPQSRDLNRSAYLGDLLVTSYSQFSRNRTLGNMVGRGYSVKSAMIEMKMIAEGYYAVQSIYQIGNEKGLDMPITKAVYNILYEKISPSIELRILENLMN
ncbi:MAG: NAD(P)H-dependent glycerol-3-phosphate dehydrogenase [Cytophagaceae bacterium]